jgi:hypothetical protein
MLTLLHITTENTEELEFFRERIEAELARRELAQRQENRSSAVVEERSRRSWTLRFERVKCGKDRCKKCAEGGPRPVLVPVLSPPREAYQPLHRQRAATGAPGYSPSCLESYRCSPKLA